MPKATKSSYANMIMESYNCVVIPPVGCVVHIQLTDTEMDVKIMSIDVDKDLEATLTVIDASSPIKRKGALFITPDEIVSVVHVPDEAPNPYHWWHIPRTRKTK